MLFKIAVQNIKKSFKDYAIYFFTLILGISIFYVFNSIESQAVLLNLTTSAYEIIELLVELLSSISVFVSGILGFLIIYASRFLIKRRQKEFGIYLILGMSKRKISSILFFETLLIGIISLAGGLLVGVIGSQFMSLVVANMFEADLTEFAFIFSPNACRKTIFYFMMMYLLVMVFNTGAISQYKLIDLLNARKKSEKVKMKNAPLCTVVFIVSVATLGYAYSLVMKGVEAFQTVDMLSKPIILGCISTFLIFWSLSGLLINIFTRMKGVYYSGLNSFVLRQFSSKINTMVWTMTLICLMLFTTVCLLSSSLSVKNSMSANLEELAPADIQFITATAVRPGVENDLTKEELEAYQFTVLEAFEKADFDLLPMLSEYVEFNVYETDDLTLYQTLGSQLEKVKEQFPLLVDYNERLMKISEYNQVAALYGMETYELENNEYIIIGNFDLIIELRNLALDKGEPITVFDHVLTPKYPSCQNGFISLGSVHANEGIILVPDEVIDESYRSENYIVGNYKTNKKDERIAFEESYYRLLNDDHGAIVSEDGSRVFMFLPSINSKIDIANASIGLGALAAFIGLYLGIIFLMASAAILALKELSESSDNVERFNLLRKIGTDEKMIHQALFRQIGIFFLFPLLLAVIHSVFGLKFCLSILETFSGHAGLNRSIVITSLILIVIYGGYFILTYLCSKNMIKGR